MHIHLSWSQQSSASMAGGSTPVPGCRPSGLALFCCNRCAWQYDFGKGNWTPRYPKGNQSEMPWFNVSFKRASKLVLVLAAPLLTSPPGRTQQAQHASMPGMDMHDHEESDMGPSMAAMAGHMYMTPLRPRQP